MQMKKKEMKGFAITHRGAEEICTEEIAELLGIKNSEIEILKTFIIFPIKTYEDLFLLCYKAQSAINISLYLDNFIYNTEEEILSRIQHTGLQHTGLELFKKIKTFKVEAIKIGSCNIRSQELEKNAGEEILKKLEAGVSLTNPDITFLIHLFENNCLLGIDFTGFDLSKRDYKIFANKEAVKGTIAYTALRFADYMKEDYLLDVFLGDGVIPIEAAFYATNFPVNHFRKDKFAFLKLFKEYDFEGFFKKIDSQADLSKAKIKGVSHLLKDVKAAQKNAKIGGIIKAVDLTKISVDWLDIKLKEGEIDKIVSLIPHSENPEKLMNELFYQTEFILSKKGTIILISRVEKNKKIIEDSAEKHGFKIEKEKEIWM